MKIPNCYEAFGQAERLAACLDKMESRRDRCGCCSRIIEPGERFWTLTLPDETCLICQDCKDEVDESESIAGEVDDYA